MAFLKIGAKRETPKKEIRIFFCTDIHGSEVCFKKFLRAGAFYGAHVLILGGDITGKMMVPILRTSGQRYEVEIAGRRQTITETELNVVMKRIEDMGNYPFVTDKSELEELRSNPEKVETLFSNLRISRIKRWLELASKELRGTDVQCYISPGNDDDFDIDKVLEESDVVINPEGKVVSINGLFEMITLGWTNPTPWDTPRECDEVELEEKINELVSQIKDLGHAIFNLHCPPYNSTLDIAVKLDDNLRPIVQAGGLVTEPVGSLAVRKAIERYQPLLGLHGHIHESRGAKKIGRTLCLNPGSEYGEGWLRGVIVNLTENGVKSYQFVRG